MKPSIAVEITARDKTEAGRKSAEKGFGAFAKKTSDQAKVSGIGKLGQQIESLTKLKGASFGFENAGRSLSLIGKTSGEVASGFGSATTKVVGFGSAAESVLGSVAEAAGTAVGVIGGLATAIIGAGIATAALGDKWSKTGAEIGRTAKDLGMSVQDLQAARAASERFGVSTDATTSSLDALGSTLRSAQIGGNNLALGTLTQLGIKLKQTKDGATDVNQAMLDISDAIARQKDPQVQKQLAQVFGMSAMLPALRQGSGALKREGSDYLASGRALTPEEVDKSTDVYRRVVTARQHVGAIEKKAGVAAEGATSVAADGAIVAADKAVSVIGSAGETAHSAVTAITEGARNLAHSGLEAGRHLMEGGKEAGRIIGEEFSRFAGRIEHQESRGHQFDRHGNPLTSSAGAIGARQLLPKTAERVARQNGIAWDPDKFAHDPAYNRKLGDLELQRLLKKYDGDEVLAAAAYNAGEGRLDKPYKDKRGHMQSGWLQRFGDPRKGEISDEDFAAKIPFRETHDYVANTAKAHVEITLRNAPVGTVAKVTGAPGVNVDMNVARSLDGPG